MSIHEIIDHIYVLLHYDYFFIYDKQVAELSEPTSPDLKEAIHSVVHGLLATLSPKVHSKVPSQSENIGTSTTNIGNEDCAELVENTSLQFEPLLTLTRDYLARLLFWLDTFLFTSFLLCACMTSFINWMFKMIGWNCKSKPCSLFLLRFSHREDGRMS